MRPRLAYSNVAATLALFFALGGTGVAARHYLITSTSQIKPNVLRELRGHNGGPGPGGPQGPAGPAGPVNLSTIQAYVGPSGAVAPKEVGGAIAFCPAGTSAVSGGGYGGISGIDVSESETGRTGWFVLTTNETSTPVYPHAEVLCAASGQAVAASARPAAHRHMEEHVAALVAKLKADKASGRS